ncbi:adenosylcobinamide amidohydrolase [uncultured Selenomonas sp.]|uniref:adenosylcobinamide amidohydrolase n=1 Tax=uncultured Selenomonas sp. TaxID=159275 RepID=UPI0025E56F5F|nr:adenosylcobinamide amidohydrolase [uncultured Selenomonas sp.]
MEGQEQMELARLTTGDIAYRYDKSIVLVFSGPRKVLSTSLYNGGYHEDFEAVFNRDMTQGSGMPCESFAPTYVESMKIVAERLGLAPELTSGMGTAAHMENASIVSRSYKELTVTAIVTGGVETNGGRVGDPASYYKTAEKKCGTINIMLVIDADLPPGILARALVTCTEAKTAALQELMAPSRYSTGLATGSGTDQTIVVANSESPLFFEGAGKHSKLGELIGLAVMAAVKEALKKQSGLTPAQQHDLLRRLRRFGVTEEALWQRYKEEVGDDALIKAQFIAALEKMIAVPALFPLGVLFIHLYDEHLWGLLEKGETWEAAEKLLKEMATALRLKTQEGMLMQEGYMESLAMLLVRAVVERAARAVSEETDADDA